MAKQGKDHVSTAPTRWSGRLILLLLAVAAVVAAYMVQQEARWMLAEDDPGVVVNELLPLDLAIERLQEQGATQLAALARHAARGALPLSERARLLDRFSWAREPWDTIPDTARPEGQLLDHQVDVQLDRYERLLGDWAARADSTVTVNQLVDQELQLQSALRQFSQVLHSSIAGQHAVPEGAGSSAGHGMYSILAVIVLFATVVLIYLLERRRKDRTIAALDQYARLSSQESGQRLFEELVGFLGAQLGVDYVMIGRLDPNVAMEIETLALWGHGQLQGNIRYSLEGTPCSDLLQRDVCLFESGVCDLYPDDALLRDMGVSAYMGTTLHNAEREPLGILVLMHTSPLTPAELDSTLLKIASARAELELERIHAEVEREQMLGELESRVDLRTRDLRRSNEQLHAEIEMRRELESQQNEARLLAETAASNKGAFITRASHEIRTHINGLLGMLTLLEDVEFSAEDRVHVTTAISSGNALLALINDMLDISKIEAGQLRLERADFDLRELFGDIRDLYGARAAEKGLKLQTEIGPGTVTALHGDAGRLRQVLANLVDNACKFTEQGSITLRASAIALADHPVGVRLEVVDTGIGIGDASPETLLRPYSQADETIARRYGGTGLGLAIASQLAELLGGHLEMEQRRSGGSRFWVTLPFEEARAPSRGAKPPATGSKPLDQQRILVVDDSRVSRAYLVDLLHSWHIDCIEAEDGRQALQEMADASEAGRPFDSVIIDRVMPEMDGLELAERLRELPGGERLTMIMVTRFGNGITGEEVLRAGITRCLNKPVSQSELFDALAVTAGARNAGKPLADDEAPSRWHLLVVEDNEINQRVTLGLLGKLGIAADVAVNGLEAIEALKTRRYDLVLMDCQMPELDGYAATRRIRLLEPEIGGTPIVAMTAHALGGEREKCLAAGMDDYLTKPVRLAQLRSTIEYWCRAGRDARPLPAVRPAADAGTSTSSGSAPTPATAVPSGDGVVNGALLDELRNIMGGDLPALIDTYLADTALRIERMRNGLEQEERQAVAEIAHTLKGSSLNLGAEELGRHSDALYKRIGAGEPADVLVPLLDQVEADFARLRPILLDYRAAAVGVS